jgi:hypothetical protein
MPRRNGHPAPAGRSSGTLSSVAIWWLESRPGTAPSGDRPNPPAPTMCWIMRSGYDNAREARGCSPVRRTRPRHLPGSLSIPRGVADLRVKGPRSAPSLRSALDPKDRTGEGATVQADASPLVWYSPQKPQEPQRVPLAPGFPPETGEGTSCHRQRSVCRRSDRWARGAGCPARCRARALAPARDPPPSAALPGPEASHIAARTGDQVGTCIWS